MAEPAGAELGAADAILESSPVIVTDPVGLAAIHYRAALGARQDLERKIQKVEAELEAARDALDAAGTEELEALRRLRAALREREGGES